MIITLEKHIYDCGLWQTSGLPCKHVMLCIARMKCTYEKYISPYYSTEAYLRYYSNMIHLLPEKYKCPHIQAEEILPQMFKDHLAGSKHFKKRKLYKPMAHKRGFNTCCKLCGVIYHNRRYCLADPADAHKKQETCWLENDLNMQ